MCKEASETHCNCTTRAERVSKAASSASWDGWFLSFPFFGLLHQFFFGCSFFDGEKMVSLFCLPVKTNARTKLYWNGRQRGETTKRSCCYWWMEQSNHRWLFCLHFSDSRTRTQNNISFHLIVDFILRFRRFFSLTGRADLTLDEKKLKIVSFTKQIFAIFKVFIIKRCLLVCYSLQLALHWRHFFLPLTAVMAVIISWGRYSPETFLWYVLLSGFQRNCNNLSEHSLHASFFMRWRRRWKNEFFPGRLYTLNLNLSMPMNIALEIFLS